MSCSFHPDIVNCQGMQGWSGSHYFHPDIMQHPDLIKGQGVVIFAGKMVVTRFRNKSTVKMRFVRGDRERFKYKLFSLSSSRSKFSKLSLQKSISKTLIVAKGYSFSSL